MSTQVWLFILYGIIGIITYVKDFHDGRILQTHIGLKGHKITIKKFLYITIIFLAVIVVYLQYKDYSSRTKLENDNKKATYQFNHSVHENFDSSFRKADTTLKKIDSVFNRLTIANKNLDRQQLVQTKLDSEAKQLLRENKNLIQQQKDIYTNVIRVLHPIFPLNLRLSISFKATYPGIKNLQEVFLNVKAKSDPRPTYQIIDGVIIWKTFINSKSGTSEAFFDGSIQNADSTLKGKALEEYHSLLSFYLSFQNNHKWMPFSARYDNYKYKDLYVEMFYSYKTNSINLDIEYTGLEYVIANRQQLNSTFGSTDLLGSEFRIAPMRCDTAYGISQISLSNKSGLQHGYLFHTKNTEKFVENDCPIYIHILKATDLIDNQKEEWPTAPIRYKRHRW